MQNETPGRTEDDWKLTMESGTFEDHMGLCSTDSRRRPWPPWFSSVLWPLPALFASAGLSTGQVVLVRARAHTHSMRSHIWPPGTHSGSLVTAW